MSTPVDSTEAADPLEAIDRQIVELLLRRGELLLGPGGVEVPLSGIRQTADRFAASVAKYAPAWPADVRGVIARGVAAASIFANRRTPTVTFLGPEFSYSYLAAVRFFSEAATLVPVQTIATVFQDVAAKRCDYGIVPIENSTDGRVIDTLSTFSEMPLTICGEVLLPINHCLLGRGPLDRIRTVYSKPQALSQCRNYLATHVPGAATREVSSTTAAVKIAAEDPEAAAVASYEAGMHFGLNLLSRGIEDSRNNATRFVVIGTKQPEPSGRDKTSLMFQIPHRSGALADAMQVFARHELNLTWIESFPIRGNPNEYLFFVELEGHRSSPPVAAAIDELAGHTVRLECLGSYPRSTAPA